MFIVWGTRGYNKNLGATIIQDDCPNCQNNVRMDACKAGKKFTLFWIPLFPVSSRYYLACPLCQHGKEISKGVVEQYLVKEQEGNLSE